MRRKNLYHPVDYHWHNKIQKTLDKLAMSRNSFLLLPSFSFSPPLVILLTRLALNVVNWVQMEKA